MRALCSLLIAALLPLPAAHADDGAMPVSAPAAAEQAAPASGAASAPEQAAPASAPAASPQATAASAPERTAASAPERAARRKSAARATAQEANVPRTRQRASAQGRKTGAGGKQTAANDLEQDRNPVIEAINLVASTQRDEIKAADRKVANADWWVDALDREWIVKRPFGPGLFDSTHWFYVSYKVNGRLLMSWFVDLTKGTVSPITPPDTQSGQR